ncbi:MAG: TerB family tellurite resistance protein [Bacteroidetes bacterium]|nr:TerB family tellurite resistance protein [Bacteroidota bacterium]MBU1720232.1 TerB family tellurite resistance protein [Bacteroidota bacterium]
MGNNQEELFCEYIQERLKGGFPTEVVEIDLDQRHSDFTLYYILYSSGLIYGLPVAFPFGLPDEEMKIEKESAGLLIMADCLLYVGFHGLNELSGKHDIANLTLAADYLNRFMFGDVKSEGSLCRAEMKFAKIFGLDQLADQKKRVAAGMFLFWDLLAFRKFIENPDEYARHPFPVAESRLLTAKHIVAASLANGKFDKEEKNLFDAIVDCGVFNAEEADSLKVLYEKGTNAEELTSDDLTWIEKKYLLEISLLVILSDKVVDELEEKYLAQLLARFDFPESEQEESVIAISVFLANNFHKLPYFKKRANPLLNLNSQYGKKLKGVFSVFKDEAVETKDMVVVFGNVLRAKLNIDKRKDMPSDKEVKEAIKQLKDVPKFLPIVVTLAMPLPFVNSLYLLTAIALYKTSGKKVNLLPSGLQKFVDDL